MAPRRSSNGSALAGPLSPIYLPGSRRASADAAHKGRGAVFLDRDGVLIENRDSYVLSPDEVEHLPGSAEAVARLSQARLVIVVTNQSAVGRGLISEQRAVALHRSIVDTVEQSGGEVAASFLCPHAPEAGCGCRKPRPGMLVAAARRLGLDLGTAWMVGDARSDLHAAARTGARGLLVQTGRGRQESETLSEHERRAWTVLPSLTAAADHILRSQS